MKPEYFVVAFCLLFAGAFFTYEKHKLGWNRDSTIVISGDNFYEEIKYAGKIRFSDDETSISSISPGGYLNFRKNENSLIAKSNKEGRLSYELTEGDKKLILDSNGKKLVADAVREMISLGIDADGRMERIYKRGGNKALINELGKLKNDNVKQIYFEHILKSDSLSVKDLEDLAVKVSTSFGSDQDKENVLRRFTKQQLTDSITMQAYMQTVESFADDYSKANALKNMLGAALPEVQFNQVMGILSGIRDENERVGLLKEMMNASQQNPGQTDKVIESANQLNDDMLREEIVMRLISEAGVPEKHFDKLLDLITHIRDDSQKENIYKKIIAGTNLSEDQWISLINQIPKFNGDFEKSNLLIQIYPKMPKTESLKSAFLKVAKTISDDSLYGKVLRTVD